MRRRKTITNAFETFEEAIEYVNKLKPLVKDFETIEISRHLEKWWMVTYYYFN